MIIYINIYNSIFSNIITSQKEIEHIIFLPPNTINNNYYTYFSYMYNNTRSLICGFHLSTIEKFAFKYIFYNKFSIIYKINRIVELIIKLEIKSIKISLIVISIEILQVCV